MRKLGSAFTLTAGAELRKHESCPVETDFRQAGERRPNWKDIQTVASG